MVRGTQRAPWGLLVPVDDIASLTTAMDLMDDGALRRRYEALSRERMQNYASDVFVRYEEVLNQ